MPSTSRMIANPLWRRTPLVLLRFPQVFCAAAASALLLVIASISGSLFLRATANWALNSAIAESDRFSAGFFVSQVGDLDSDASDATGFTSRDRVLRDATCEMDHLGGPIVTVYGEPVAAAGAGTTSTQTQIRLISRTGALGHIRQLSGRQAKSGLWLSDLTAEHLGVRAGDSIVLRGGSPSESAGVQVAGVFRALINDERRPYWSSLYALIFPDLGDPVPPALAIADRELVTELSRSLGQTSATFQWDFPIATGSPPTLRGAENLHQQLQGLAESLTDATTELGRAFTGFRSVVSGSSLGIAIGQARNTIGGLKAPVDLLSIAGGIAALVVVAAAGAYGMHRRRSEAMFLFARGMNPPALALKAGVESLLPVIAGVILGYGAAVVLAGWLGARGIPLDSEAITSAARTGAAIIPLAAGALGVAAAVSSVREARVSELPGRAFNVPWEAVALLAALVLYRITLRETSLVQAGVDNVTHVNYVVLLFPVLFIGASSGIIARAFKFVMRSLSQRSRGFTAALYLGSHRLAGARRLAVLLMTASGLAIGVFAYAQTMVKSLESTTRAKAYLFTGSDANVIVDRIYEPPPDFPWPSTKVSQVLDRASLVPDGARVSILAVDAPDLPEVAYWDGSFGHDSMDELMGSVISVEGDRLGAVAVGDVPSNAFVEISGAHIPLEVTARVSSFPGTWSGIPWLIVDGDDMARLIEAAGGRDPRSTGVLHRLWAKGNPSAIQATFGNLGYPPDEVTTATEVLERPAFVSVSRAFRFLRALAFLAAVVVLVGTVLYLQARLRGRAISYSLARRMGLGSGAHLKAVAFELGTMLLVSAVGGLILGVTTAVLLYSRIDPLPRLIPDPLLRIPLWLPLPLFAGVSAVTIVGAYLAHRAAERADVAQALRQSG